MIDDAREDPDEDDYGRAYAHVGHRKNTICVGHGFFDLPGNYQLALIFHEIGHIIGDTDDEKTADKIVYDLFGVTICYDDENELQHLDTGNEWVQTVLKHYDMED